MNFLNQKASNIIKEITLKECKKIKVRPGTCRYNYKCHMNAVHDALVKGQTRVAMCIYLDSNTPIIHFINVSKKGKFIDNTLGCWCVKRDFYLIRYIEQSEFYQIDSIFGNYREYLTSRLPWWVRLLSNNLF